MTAANRWDDLVRSQLLRRIAFVLAVVAGTVVAVFVLFSVIVTASWLFFG